jgi:hypothetical protein
MEKINRKAILPTIFGKTKSSPIFQMDDIGIALTKVHLFEAEFLTAWSNASALSQ